MKAPRPWAVLVVLGVTAAVAAAERPPKLVRPLPNRLAVHRAGAHSVPEGPRTTAVEAAVKELDITDEGMCAGRSSGGPDPYGYTFIDSSEPGGPAFDWVELSGLGTQVSLPDDGSAGPFPIGFSFSFYGHGRAEFYVHSNGAVTFTPVNVPYRNRCPLPDASYPRELIALMWDDLDPSRSNDPVWFESFGAGDCPYDGYAGSCLVVEYEDFCHYPGGPGCASAGTFELILLDDHSLVMQFLDPGDESGSGSTTGIQSAEGIFGLTYACSLSYSLASNRAVRFERTPPSQPVVLAVDDDAIEICPRTPAVYTFTVLNNTGATTGFDVLYSGFSWNVGGEVSIGPLEDGDGATFTVLHRPPDAAIAGATDSGSVTVRSQSGPESATLAVTSSVALYLVTTGPNAPDPRMDHGAVLTVSPSLFSLDAIAGYSGAYPVAEPDAISQPVTGLPSIGSVTPEATVNRFNLSNWWRRSSDWNPIPFPADLAHGLNVSGEAVVVAFPDTTGLSDLLLHIYNLPRDRWDRAPLPAGLPPNGIWGHDITCDRAANTCYLTGGASSPGGGDLTTLYAYDVAANTVATLPQFTSPRAHHASFLFDGMLCIAGGVDATDAALSSTQCFDLTDGSWHPENSDLGPLPGTLWGMADAVMEMDGAMRPVLAGGIHDGGPPGNHLVWHDGTAWQHDTPLELGVYRLEAVAHENRLLVVGGATAGVVPTNVLQTVKWCRTGASTNDDCATAIPLEFADTAVVTNEFATDSGPPMPSCADYQGADVWLLTTVPADALVPCFEVGHVPGSPVVEIGISYYAECPHETEIECGSTNATFGVVYPQQPGTYWIRAWEEGNDTFGSFSVSAGDCWIPVELMSFTVE